MHSTIVEVGRVIRVGRGWADVTVEGKVRRISTRPDLLVRAGTYLQIINDRAVAEFPTSPSHTSREFH